MIRTIMAGQRGIHDRRVLIDPGIRGKSFRLYRVRRGDWERGISLASWHRARRLCTIPNMRSKNVWEGFYRK